MELIAQAIIYAIPGYDRYGVDVFGNVWSKRKDGWRKLKPCPDGRGYPKVKLGKYPTFNVHKLIALVFFGPCPDGMTINHIDGNKTNAALSNLEYISQSDNNKHAWRIGLQRSGWDTRRSKVA